MQCFQILRLNYILILMLRLKESNQHFFNNIFEYYSTVDKDSFEILSLHYILILMRRLKENNQQFLITY
jgi:hypothetical protein